MRQFLRSFAATTIAVALAPISASAQQMDSTIFNVDTYWKDYWNWYDNEYVPSYRMRTYVYPGASPAISGAPDAGGNYGDYASDFYVPGGTSAWYGQHLRAPREDNVREQSRRERQRSAPDQADLRPEAAREASATSQTPDGTPAAAEGSQQAVDGPRTRTGPIPRAGQDPDAIPPDLDATPREPAPVTDAAAEIWY